MAKSQLPEKSSAVLSGGQADHPIWEPETGDFYHELLAAVGKVHDAARSQKDRPVLSHLQLDKGRHGRARLPVARQTAP
jgi:hypothetical protein